MAEIPEGAKKPQDRKKKADDKDVPEAFSFTDDDGVEHTLAPTAEKIRPGFIRRMRHSEDPSDITFSALEEIATEDELAVIDNLSWASNMRVLKEFDAYIGDFFQVSLGE